VIIWDAGVRLASDWEGSVPDPSTPVTINSRGEFLTRTHSPGEFAVWDSTGAFLRTVGRDGEGPGEIKGWPGIQVDPWDSVHVRDSKYRWSVFAPDFTFVRMMPNGGELRTDSHALFLESDTIIDAIGIKYPGGPSGLFSLFSRSDGGFGRSFGEVLPTDRTLPRRHLAQGPDDTFWAIPGYAYRAEQWTVSGERVRVVERWADWFPRGLDDSGWNRADEPPPPVITAIHHDQVEDLLWVRLMVPDPRRLPVEEAPESVVAAVAYHYDVIVEVLDLQSSRVLASHRADGLEGSILGFLKDGRGYRLSEDEDGFWSIEILSLRVAKADASRGRGS
jgi:hypothetical protein